VGSPHTETPASGEPAIFIECKACGKKLDTHSGQLARYFNATPSVRVGVLTNGVEYKVFTDLQKPNVMDPTPWLEVDLFSLDPVKIDALRRLRKQEFNTEKTVALAEEMVFYAAMVEYMSRQLREPDDGFVRHVACQIPAGGRVTQRLVERLTPILKKAIQSAILENVAKSLQQGEPEETTPPPAVATQDEECEDEKAANEEEGAEGKREIVTTEDELKCFAWISEWIREAIPDAPVAYRDSRSWFALTLGGAHNWFARLNVEKTPFWLMLRHIAAEEARALAPGMEISPVGGGANCKIALYTINDMAKLRTAIIAAYEKRAAWKEAKGSADAGSSDGGDARGDSNH
jgi:hypothetical protein